ncbi:MAG: peptidyl-prolyl cis-trans isomerase [Bacteroidaceae bacterium]|nr:peptidyl-prolyl cis-trans isomerase [Bacteroidaceae bacterium]MBR6856048.1 peptidyl-prolyl cis-trans isomerase [Bacteroidaceae bacterium]
MMRTQKSRNRFHAGLIALVSITLLVSCKWNKSVTEYVYGKTPIVEIGTDVLYVEDIKQVVPLGLSEADSTLFAQQFIKNWAQDVLFYQNAIRNIPDTKDIDRLVENYRRSLIEHEYQRRLIEQKFSSETAEEDIERFYNDNERLFVLDESLLRGLFLKISNKSHDLSDIRKLYTRQDDESFEEIEKYSIRNAARCEFFYDNWRTVAEIEVLLPPLEKPLETMLKDNGSFEFKDEEYIYLLNVSEFAPKGGIEPLDHARSRIRGLLINSNEVSYMRKIKEDLYDAAIEKNRIIFHQ